MVAELIHTTPGLVNPVLTEDQATLVHQALIAMLNSPEGSLGSSIEEDINAIEDKTVRDQLSELVFFFSNVVDHPEAFGVRSQKEVMKLLRAVKPQKGPAKLSSRRHGRKRQTGRGQRKKNSLATKIEAAEFNAARDRVEADKAEMEQAHNDEMKKRIDRSNELLIQDSLTNEELQELLEIMGYSNVAEAARIMRAENSPESRIERAVQKARAEGAED